MAFPDVKFEFDDKDVDLIAYLKAGRQNFTFLRKPTLNQIKKLASEELDQCRSVLNELWPKVIIDALLKLRETDGEIVEANSIKLGERIPPRRWKLLKTFFHEESLSREEVTTVFKAFADFETILYGASPKKYRDHLAHVFRVWISGHGLIKRHFAFKLTAPGSHDLPITAGEWECMWALAALCHDLGYPVRYIESINQKAREAFRGLGLLPAGDLQFRFSPQARLFHDAMIRFMASTPVKAPCLRTEQTPRLHHEKSTEERYVSHLQNKYYVKLLQSFDDLDHGIISALLISKCLVHFLESDLCHDPWKPLTSEAARQCIMRREILRAIAFHSCPEVYHVQFDTLAFVLYILDEIQEWGRPTLDELQTREQKRVTSTVVEFKPKHISVALKYKRRWTRKDLPDLENKLNQLHKRVRLGADTYVSEDQHLEFRMEDSAGKKAYFLLNKQRISRHVPPKKSLPSNA